MRSQTYSKPAKGPAAGKASLSILILLCLAHFLNDALQMVLPAIYPLLKENYRLTFTQIGLITLAFQITASLFQPLVGAYTDKKTMPFSMAFGLGFTFLGFVYLAVAKGFYPILGAAMLIGAGSAVFHPEASRVARYASGGKAGTAQSIFQVGGNTGSAVGPLLAAVIVIPFGQKYVATFALLALLAIFVLWKVGIWFKDQALNIASKKVDLGMDRVRKVSKKEADLAMVILLVLIFSKFFYLAAVKNYLTFYLIEHFGVSIQSSQIYLFVFLAAIAAGTMIGGPIGDRYGRKNVIWASILGVAPFALALPFANLFWSIVLLIFIGIIISSAFPAIIVFGQELRPEKLGMISGLFYGSSFGMGAIGAAVLGVLADKTSVYFMFQVTAFLPLLGLCTWLLPNIEDGKEDETNTLSVD